MLILDFLSRGAALLGFGFHLFLALVYASSIRWMFEQPHEYIPMLILAFVPSGRYWGMDRLLLKRWPLMKHRPF